MNFFIIGEFNSFLINKKKTVQKIFQGIEINIFIFFSKLCLKILFNYLIISKIKMQKNFTAIEISTYQNEKI